MCVDGPPPPPPRDGRGPEGRRIDVMDEAADIMPRLRVGEGFGKDIRRLGVGLFIDQR